MRDKATVCVSVIMPVHNSLPYLEEALNSLRNQSFGDWEAILVENASSDESCKVCREFAAQDCRFRVLELSSVGVAAARNAGLEHATGEYIAFVDSDDVIHRDFLKRLVDAIVSTGADQIYADTITFEDGACPLFNEAVGQHGCFYRQPWLEYPAYGLGFGLCHSLYRASSIGDLRLPEDVGCGEDRVFGYQFLAKNPKIYHIPGWLYGYRQRANSIVHTEMNDAKLCWLTLVLKAGCAIWNADHKWDALRKKECVMMIKQMLRLGKHRAIPYLAELRMARILRYNDFSLSWRWRIFRALHRLVVDIVNETASL